MVAMPTPYCCSIRPFIRLATPSTEVGTSERPPSSARGLHGREACPAGTPPKRSGRDKFVGVVPLMLCFSTVKNKVAEVQEVSSKFAVVCDRNVLQYTLQHKP